MRQVIQAERLWDGSGRPVLLDDEVQIEDGRIAWAGTRQEAPPGQGESEVRVFPGCTVLPGLIDTHVHLVFSARDTHQAVIDQVTSEDDGFLLARALANARAA